MMTTKITETLSRMHMTKMLSMAALALLTLACSNDDADSSAAQGTGKGIPFTATITMDTDEAATRALSEQGTTIKTSWRVDDEIALVYSVDGQSYNTTATVFFVMDGTAYITATLEDGVTNGTPITVISPASAADGATGNVKPNLLRNQKGTLDYISQNLDVRKGTGIVSVSGGYAELGSCTKLRSQYSISKFTLGMPVSSTVPLFIRDGDGGLISCVQPKYPVSTIYVALEPVANQTFRFEATGETNKILKRARGTLEAGRYYQSELPVRYPLVMSALEADVDEGCIIATDGKIYMNRKAVPTSLIAEAMVAYIGAAKDNTYGLGFALSNVTDPANSSGFYWSKAAEAVSTWGGEHPVEGATWRLPSKTDWETMFMGCMKEGDYVAFGDNTCTINGFKEKIAAVGITKTFMPTDNYYRTSDGGGRYVSFSNLFTDGSCKATFATDADIRAYVRACLVF